MSSSSSVIPCVAEKCELTSLALCQCCKKNLCIDHLNKHANQRLEMFVPLIDTVNTLLSRFGQLDEDGQSEFKQLNEWKQNAYESIDKFYEMKRETLMDEAMNKQREQLNDMNSQLTELIRKKGGTQQDFDRFSQNLRLIEEHLNKTQQITVNLPLVTIVDNNLMQSVSSQTDFVENTSCDSMLETNNNDNSEKNVSDKKQSSDNKKSSEKSSKKKKKSSRYSGGSPDRSSHYRSRSPSYSHRTKRKRNKSLDSNSSHSSSSRKAYCDDCRDCRFYQDRFGPGFMDSFGPCHCNCHKWAYPEQN